MFPSRRALETVWQPRFGSCQGPICFREKVIIVPNNVGKDFHTTPAVQVPDMYGTFKQDEVDAFPWKDHYGFHVLGFGGL